MYVKCTFCHTKFVAPSDCECVWAECPACGARVDIQASAVTSGYGLYGLLLLLPVILGILTFLFYASAKSPARPSLRTVPLTTKSGRAGITPQDLWQARLRRERERFHPPCLPRSWRENPENFGRALYQAYLAMRQPGNQHTQARHYVSELRDLAHQQDHTGELARKFRQLVQLKEEWALQACQRRLGSLGMALRRQILITDSLPAQKQLRQVLLTADFFFEYALLFCPACETALYWDWEIGMHYGFTKTRIGQLQGHKSEIWAWDKVPHLYKGRQVRCVLHGDGRVSVWGEERFVRWYQLNQRTKARPCPHCHGQGTVVCPMCHGSGKISGVVSRVCPKCHGQGQIPCPYCHGQGRVYQWK